MGLKKVKCLSASVCVLIDEIKGGFLNRLSFAALKVKLMVRRPITTLVAQGILPSPKTSPALHEQRQKLERAKMGDMLRAKIAKRPDRAELVHRHILEDVRPGVDPSLCDKQRQLKRAKLIDTLSNQLQARPGPLELVAKNILHDDSMEQALKEGAIQFKPTNEGLPTKYTVLDNDCDSNSEPHSPQEDILKSVVKSESHDAIFKERETQEHRRRASDVSLVPSPSSSSQSPSPSPAATPGGRLSSQQQPYSQRGAPGKDPRKSKKSKAKSSTSVAGTKQKVIRFHEYKVS